MKCTAIFVLALVAVASAGIVSPVVPYAAYATAPFASSYNAHSINHAYAPAAPLVAHAAPVVAAAPARYVASPYVASPYVASPYVAGAPLVF